MFTDMVGFTALTQSDERQSLEVLDRHNRLLRPFFSKFHGREVKAVGDSFLVEFESALDATSCAVEIQRFLHDYNLSSRDEWRITLRIGIHLGDVVRSGDDILGDAVNIASRLQPLAEPEGICLSDQVYGQVRNKMPQNMVKLEPHDLKGVKFTVDAYKVVMPWEKPAEESSARDRNRVAVLPFANMSPDPADEYFADGMTEELISTISRVEETEVVSRTSVMQYKKSPKPVKEISKELEAGTVLEGSVRKAGNRLRVTVQMIDAARDKHMWTESYDRNLDDVFAIQSEIAEQVAGALRAKLPRGGAVPSGSTENLEAYTLFLRAKQLGYERTEAALAEKITLLQSAIAKDPGFARAYAELAISWRHNTSREDYASAIAKAEAYATKALELGPELAEAHTAMAAACLALDRFQKARQELEAAIRINPNLSDAQTLLGEVSCTFGDIRTALEHYKRAFALDPLSVGSGCIYSHLLRVAGRVEEALKVTRQLRELHPASSQPYDPEFAAYLQLKDYVKASAAIEEGLGLAPGNPLLKLDRACLNALTGRRNEAESEIAEFLKAKGSRGPNAKFWVSVFLKDYDETFRVLDEQAETHSWYFAIKVEPLLADLRKDPRFSEFCLKVGIPP